MSWNVDLVGKCFDWKASNEHFMPLNFEPDDNYVQQMSFTLLESQKSRFKSFDSDVIRKSWSYFFFASVWDKKKWFAECHILFSVEKQTAKANILHLAAQWTIWWTKKKPKLLKLSLMFKVYH